MRPIYERVFVTQLLLEYLSIHSVTTSSGLGIELATFCPKSLARVMRASLPYLPFLWIAAVTPSFHQGGCWLLGLIDWNLARSTFEVVSVSAALQSVILSFVMQGIQTSCSPGFELCLILPGNPRWNKNQGFVSACVSMNNASFLLFICF